MLCRFEERLSVGLSGTRTLTVSSFYVGQQVQVYVQYSEDVYKIIKASDQHRVRSL